MKIRNGFVSNSSSSSFIVGVKDGKKTSTRVKLEIEVDLAKYGTDINSIEELIKYYTDERYVEFEDLEHSETYLQAKKVIEKGGVVILGSFSDQDEALERLLCEMGLKSIVKDSNIEIIESEGGY